MPQDQKPLFSKPQTTGTGNPYEGQTVNDPIRDFLLGAIGWNEPDPTGTIATNLGAAANMTPFGKLGKLGSTLMKRMFKTPAPLVKARNLPSMPEVSTALDSRITSLPPIKNVTPKPPVESHDDKLYRLMRERLEHKRQADIKNPPQPKPSNPGDKTLREHDLPGKDRNPNQSGGAGHRLPHAAPSSLDPRANGGLPYTKRIPAFRSKSGMAVDVLDEMAGPRGMNQAEVEDLLRRAVPGKELKVMTIEGDNASWERPSPIASDLGPGNELFDFAVGMKELRPTIWDEDMLPISLVDKPVEYVAELKRQDEGLQFENLMKPIKFGNRLERDPAVIDMLLQDLANYFTGPKFDPFPGNLSPANARRVRNVHDKFGPAHEK